MDGRTSTSICLRTNIAKIKKNKNYEDQIGRIAKREKALLASGFSLFVFERT